MALPVNYPGTLHLEKAIRSYHNRAVSAHFKGVRASDLSTPGGRVYAAMLIRPGDSAIDICNKQLLFARITTNKAQGVTIPDHWVRRPGADVPQLVVVYRAEGRKASGYSTCIPHYEGSKTVNPPAYTKGNFRGEWVLDDGAKFVVNTRTEAEAKKLWRYWETKIDAKFKKNVKYLGKMQSTDYKQIKVEWQYADYYPTGQANTEPKWRVSA